MLQRVLAATAMVITLLGVGFGMSVAVAEGNGCITYVQQTPPGFVCNPTECNDPNQTCIMSAAPSGPQCACDGNWQYPFCQASHTMDPNAGFTMVCTVVLCPSPGADCEIKVAGPGVFYCKCE